MQTKNMIEEKTKSKPIYSKIWFWGLIILLVFLFIILTLLFLRAGRTVTPLSECKKIGGVCIPTIQYDNCTNFAKNYEYNMIRSHTSCLKKDQICCIIDLE